MEEHFSAVHLQNQFDELTAEGCWRDEEGEAALVAEDPDRGVKLFDVHQHSRSQSDLTEDALIQVLRPEIISGRSVVGPGL